MTWWSPENKSESDGLTHSPSPDVVGNKQRFSDFEVFDVGNGPQKGTFGRP